jgi:hypothetical protein
VQTKRLIRKISVFFIVFWHFLMFFWMYHIFERSVVYHFFAPYLEGMNTKMV